MKSKVFVLLTGIVAALGFVFAAFSTHDFVAHLDRQIHGIHCSFLPGLAATDATGSTGCHVTMMSPYSSMLRQEIWGGLPISLPAMGVFGFLVFAAFAVLLLGRHRDTRTLGLLVIATLVPVFASVVMAFISFSELGAACKLCIGIYITSALGFAFAVTALWLARRAPVVPRRMGPDDTSPPAVTEESSGPPLRWGILGAAIAAGILFVIIPAVVYAAAAPDFSHYIGECGKLQNERVPSAVLISLGSGGGADAIEILDPLCPACRAFERRLGASGLGQELDRKALLFPLDNECNWMVDRAIHPGACTVSEAMLCAERDAEEVLTWAFEEQEAIREAAARDPKAAARMVGERFPKLRGCVGKPAVRAKLNRALRWAVDNEIPVLTPQLYVEGVRMCDEDTDLGMDYALSQMLERARLGKLRAENGR